MCGSCGLTLSGDADPDRANPLATPNTPKHVDVAFAPTHIGVVSEEAGGTPPDETQAAGTTYESFEMTDEGPKGRGCVIVLAIAFVLLAVIAGTAVWQVIAGR